LVYFQTFVFAHLDGANLASKSCLYFSRSSIIILALPASMEALATAGQILPMILGSNGVGITYSAPKERSRLTASLTDYGTSSLANSARARAAAIFISSFIDLDLVSRVALKRNGKHITLLI
jgi:hypothetical protein